MAAQVRSGSSVTATTAPPWVVTAPPASFGSGLPSTSSSFR